jgi:hypothetical protein
MHFRINVYQYVPAKKDCLPAITAFLKARAISYGFFAFAIAVLTKTPSQPNSIAIVASDAWPKPASMIRGNFGLISDNLNICFILNA